MPIPATSNEPSSAFIIGSLVAACSAQVPRCPEPGESLEATGFIVEAGGKGFNVALAAHRLGVPVDGVFAVGDDPPGNFLRKSFSDMELGAGLIHTVKGATGAGVGLIQADGENRIAVYPGANASLSAEHVLEKAAEVRKAGVVFAQFEAPDAPIATAFALARDAGVVTMLNPSPYRPIAREILATTDIMVMNEREAAAFAKVPLWTGPYDDITVSLAENGVSILIITRGSRGASAWYCGGWIEQPGFAIDAVDSIGAGDAFTGAVIAALARGGEFATALRWGCAAGALTVTRLGVRQALPCMEELITILGRTDIIS